MYLKFFPFILGFSVCKSNNMMHLFFELIRYTPKLSYITTAVRFIILNMDFLQWFKNDIMFSEDIQRRSIIDKKKW
jgi:hypothetical protein